MQLIGLIFGIAAFLLIIGETVNQNKKDEKK